jgi:hypothetical protein
MKTATLVERIIPTDSGAVQGLYRLSEPIAYYTDYTRSKTSVATANYVIVSSVTIPFSGPETFIFPADKDGEILNWGELEGSFRGEFNHKKALEGAGYEVVDNLLA